MAKIRKEETQINLFQEFNLSHLSKAEPEKCVFFGDLVSKTPSISQYRVAILMPYVIKFECQKEIKDKEGTYCKRDAWQNNHNVGKHICPT